ncbi:MAG: RnfABCDGE type electron transport complex subunit G [Candidatus Omnitrophica bacterium]|nr:RnfABCDGE type electron transport complex subunit G [Candidatus Omnitrophota bacterium]
MSKKEIITGIIVLLIISMTSGCLLSWVYGATKPRIDEQKKIEAARINREIFPEGAKFSDTITENGMTYVEVYSADGGLAGRVFDVTSAGYGGPVAVKIGIDGELRIKGVRILSHTETPGLGSKISDIGFLDQFKDKFGNTLCLKKDSAEGTVDAITGATISSRAVADGIKKLQEKLSRAEK